MLPNPVAPTRSRREVGDVNAWNVSTKSVLIPIERPRREIVVARAVVDAAVRSVDTPVYERSVRFTQSGTLLTRLQSLRARFSMAYQVPRCAPRQGLPAGTAFFTSRLHADHKRG